jgi:hypothetical protein
MTSHPELLGEPHMTSHPLELLGVRVRLHVDFARTTEYGDVHMQKPDYHVFFRDDTTHDIFTVVCSNWFGACHSGWTTATQGECSPLMKVEGTVGSLHYVPKNPRLRVCIERTYDPYGADLGPTGRIYFMTKPEIDLLTFSRLGNWHSYYPEGWSVLNTEGLISTARLPSARPVYVCSCREVQSSAFKQFTEWLALGLDTTIVDRLETIVFKKPYKASDFFPASWFLTDAIENIESQSPAVVEHVSSAPLPFWKEVFVVNTAHMLQPVLQYLRQDTAADPRRVINVDVTSADCNNTRVYFLYGGTTLGKSHLASCLPEQLLVIESDQQRRPPDFVCFLRAASAATTIVVVVGNKHPRHQIWLQNVRRRSRKNKWPVAFLHFTSHDSAAWTIASWLRRQRDRILLGRLSVYLPRALCRIILERVPAGEGVSSSLKSRGVSLMVSSTQDMPRPRMHEDFASHPCS